MSRLNHNGNRVQFGGAARNKLQQGVRFIMALWLQGLIDFFFKQYQKLILFDNLKIFCLVSNIIYWLHEPGC